MPDPNILVSAAVKPDGVSAEVVRAAFDDVVRFVVCPRLIDEFRVALGRDRFRRYLSRDQADVLVDATEAASEVVSNPKTVQRVSVDPDDDYLIALARRERVDGIVSGDPDLTVHDGPLILTPRDVLHRLQLNSTDRQLLVTALWNLHLRIDQVTDEPAGPQLPAFLEVLRSATRKLGGNPDTPLFGLPELAGTRAEVRDLNRDERTACAYAIELDRRTAGALHTEHLEEVERLSSAFEIFDRYAGIEHLLPTDRPTGA